MFSSTCSKLVSLLIVMADVKITFMSKYIGNDCFQTFDLPPILEEENYSDGDGFNSSVPRISCVDMLCVSDILYKFMLSMQVPVRVAGGLLFELLGQSVGDPNHEEEVIPIVLRSWQTQNFLLTAMHVKGPSSNNNVLGVTEVQVSTESFLLIFLF